MTKMNSTSMRFHSARNRSFLSFVCVTTAWIFAGCDQPIYEKIEPQLPPTQFDLSSAANAERHNWPFRGGLFTVSKPPPLAYLTSYGDRIAAPPLQLSDDQTFWKSNEVSDAVRPFLEDLFTPAPSQPNWVGTITKADFSGPQAFDMSADGKRLVTINAGQFSLFQTVDGKRIGRRGLPGDWNNDPPTAIRFAPKSNDFLVASAKKVCRISSKNGELIGEIDGPGEPVKKWLVADDESFMVMLTESGRLFAGDSELQNLERLKLAATDDDATFDDFGMSLDGIRVAVAVNGQPRTYLQEGGRIVDLIEYPNVSLPQSPVISSGLRDDLWISPSRSFCTFAESGPNSNVEFGQDNTVARKIALAPKRGNASIQMFWKLAFLQPIRSPPGEIGEWALGVSQRPVDGKYQWVVHDINLRKRLNSVPLPIDGRPTRFLSNRWATTLAIADDHAIRLASRKVWQNSGPECIRPSASLLFFSGDLKSFEKYCEILHEKERWTLVGSSEDALAEVLAEASERWRWLVMRRDLDGEAMEPKWKEALDLYEAWFKEGSFWAKTIHAHQLHRQAWSAREGKDGQGGDTWTRYRTLREKAAAELEALLQEERPTAASLARYVGCYLEVNDQLDVADSVCRRCVDLYPRSRSIANAMGFKLLPRWYGETGDCLSYLKGHAQLFDEPQASLLYYELIGNACVNIGNSAIDFRSLDAQLLGKGVDYFMQQRRFPGRWFQRNQILYQMLGIEAARVDRMNRYLLETTAVMPANYKVFENRQLHNNQAEWLRLLSEVKE